MLIVVRLDRLVFGVHDMDWRHVEKWLGCPRPPIEVELLPEGRWFVHNGRHRATAAYEDGDDTILAVQVT